MNLEFLDQMNRKVQIDFPPKRIVSLVPSQTELLFDLGLSKQLVGITKFCIHPEEVYRSKRRVGGTKTISLDVVKELQPDLIIANKEENQQEQIEELMQLYPVWISDISTFTEAMEMISLLGSITDKQSASLLLRQEIDLAWSKLKPRKKERIIYLIWQDPIMVAGLETFIDNILHLAGFQNLIKQTRYPEMTLDDLQSLAPDRLFLSSEPYPFKEKHLKAFQRQLPHTKVQLVDGELFSWYGSRLKCVPPYLNSL